MHERQRDAEPAPTQATAAAPNPAQVPPVPPVPNPMPVSPVPIPMPVSSVSATVQVPAPVPVRVPVPAPVTSDLPLILRPTAFDPWPDTSVHVEWGRTGAALAAARGDVVVVVDVLSFSTTLSIAAARDFTCLIYSNAEIETLGGPAMAAIRLGARPLSRRRTAEPGRVSLSPASLLDAEPGQRVIFTSLNGASVISAASKAPALLIGAPRNATACAALAAQIMATVRAGRVTIVACGEHWSSVDPAVEGPRPAVEDWLGAGAICAQLAERGYSLSAEARLAASAWTHPTALADVADCVSARELRAAGFATDVDLALQVDADTKVPTRMTGEQTGRVFLGIPAAAHEGESSPVASR